MADAVTTQLYDGEHNVALILNSLSDGTGETLVKKLDVTSLVPNPGTHLVLWRVVYDVTPATHVVLYWEGTPNKIMLATAGSGTGEFFFGRHGGLKDDATTATGNVLLSTIGFVASSTYLIHLEFKKGGVI